MGFKEKEMPSRVSYELHFKLSPVCYQVFAVFKTVECFSTAEQLKERIWHADKGYCVVVVKK